MKRRIVSIVTMLVICTTWVLSPMNVLSVKATETETNDTVTEAEVAPQGMRIEGQDVSGLGKDEINKVVDEYIHKFDDVKFTFKAMDEKFNTTAKELSLKAYNDISDAVINYGSKGNIVERFQANADIESGAGRDFSLILSSDEQKTEQFLEENARELDSAPIDNGLIREDGEFKFIEGKPGKVVDSKESAIKIAEYIETKWNKGDAEMDLELIQEEPKGSREELEAVKDLLGACSTDFSSSSSARAANVKNGTSKLDQSLIYPGEEFSVSTNLESRNAENGYLPAPSYENGTTVDTYGGGVCQISTTLYNAVIRSELEIVERHPHSMVVSYVKPSMDAAISEGSKDFVFKNNKNYPIYIEGYTSGGVLYFNIFGKEERPSNREVSYESEVLSETDPGTRYVASGDLPIGSIVREQSSHRGYTAQLVKVVKENGEETSREVFNSSRYMPSPAIYKVGVAGDPGVAAGVHAAIETQNRDAINAAMGAVPAPAPVEQPVVEQPVVEEQSTEEETPKEEKKKKKEEKAEEKASEKAPEEGAEE